MFGSSVLLGGAILSVAMAASCGDGIPGQLAVFLGHPVIKEEYHETFLTAPPEAEDGEEGKEGQEATEPVEQTVVKYKYYPGGAAWEQSKVLIYTLLSTAVLRKDFNKKLQ